MKNLLAYSDRLTMFAIVLIVLGLALRYIIGKRRFNRRNVAGIQ